MKKIWLLLLFLAACASPHAPKGPGMAFYVSPEGNDHWSGLRAAPDSGGVEGPFRTPERAREAVHALRASGKWPGGGVIVYLAEGTYELTKTLHLTASESGTKDAPLLWRPVPGDRVRLVGGKRILRFRPVNDPAILKRLDILHRREIVAASLRLQNIWDTGALNPRGFGRETFPAGLEIFCNGKPMTLSRWPNEGWAKIAGTDDAERSFRYDGDRSRRWTDLSDIWVHGYWDRDRADSFERIQSIDPDTQTITTREPHGVYGYKTGQRFYFLNILEELDSPGEWYLDRRTTLLYFWPPEPIEKCEVMASLLETPLIRLENASYVTFRGMTMEVARGNAVEITGGAGNRIAGCTIRNTGNHGVVIRGGRNNGVQSCEISETGESGIILEGGDRRTLKPAGNFADNNHIHHFSRWVRTGCPAIALSGVGNRVTHNYIHDAPHSGVQFEGNDHLLEYNEIGAVCRETVDAGAVYSGRSWTMRGNVIRYNYFHDISGTGGGGAMAVYLDDAFSGTMIYGNIFLRASRAAFIGGGRDNTVENNIFVRCEPSVHIDGRGTGHAKENMARGGDWRMYEELDAMDYRRPPYSKRYPKLLTIAADDPALPMGNVIARNISSGGKWLEMLDGVDSLNIVTVRDNSVDSPDMVNPNGTDFRLRKDSPSVKMGFQPIPCDKIGLYRDDYRVQTPGGVK